MKSEVIQIVPNPVLATVPVNAPCVCGSAQKFKKCCRSKFESYVPVEQAAVFNQELRNLGYRPAQHQPQQVRVIQR